MTTPADWDVWFHDDPRGVAVLTERTTVEAALKEHMSGQDWENAETMGWALQHALAAQQTAEASGQVRAFTWWGAERNPAVANNGTISAGMDLCDEFAAWRTPRGWACTYLPGETPLLYEAGLPDCLWYDRVALTCGSLERLVGPCESITDLMHAVLDSRTWPYGGIYDNVNDPAAAQGDARTGAMLWGLLHLLDGQEQQAASTWLALAEPDLVPLLAGKIWQPDDPDVLAYPEQETEQPT